MQLPELEFIQDTGVKTLSITKDATELPASFPSFPMCFTHWASKYTLREASPVWIVKSNGTSGQGAEEKLVFLTDQSFLFAHNAKSFVLEAEMKSFWVCGSVQSHLTRAAAGLWCEPWAAERAGWLCSLIWSSAP